MRGCIVIVNIIGKFIGGRGNSTLNFTREIDITRIAESAIQPLISYYFWLKKNIKKSQSHGRVVSRQWYSETGREGIPPEIPSLPVDVLTNQRASYN